MSENTTPETNQLADIAAALQQFQVALDLMKKSGLLTGDLQLPVITAAQKPKDATTTISSIPVVLAKPRPAKELKPKKKVQAPDTVDAFITWFCTTPRKNLYDVTCGQWEIITGSAAEEIADTLVFHSKAKARGTAGHIICLRPKDTDLVLFNASNITYGNTHRDQKHPQVVAEAAGAIPIPFEVIKAGGDAGAGLDLDKVKIVAHDAAEQLLIPPVERIDMNRWGHHEVCQRHFAGATVLRINKDSFLFDCDRQELKAFGFNPFFTRLNVEVKSTAEAYKALMPKAVQDAIDAGLDVKRQGEFFFVPANEVEVRNHILGTDSSRNYAAGAAYTYCVTLAKIMGLARHQVWKLNNELHEDMSKFIESCKKNFKGKLPKSDKTESEYDAEETLKVLMADLKTAPSVDMDWSISCDRFYQHRSQYGTGSEILRENSAACVDRELGNLLTDGKHMTWQYGDEPGPLAHWGIKINHSLGVIDPNGSTRGRHMATAMVAPKPQEVYAIGTVMHGGREHRPVFLPRWFRVYSNTATSNWTVQNGTAC